MKTIKSGLDVAQLDKAIKELKQYRDKELPEKIDKFLEKLCRTIAETANDWYNRDPNSGQVWYDGEKRNLPVDSQYNRNVNIVYHKVQDGLWMVDAMGRGVCFIEFGAGVYASVQDLDHERMAANVGVYVWPGSWSDEHGETWKEWIESGKDPYKYIYNLKPRPGLYKGIQKAETEIRRMIRRGEKDD